MIYLRLIWEFMKIGIFAFGGGMATIPFLQDLAERTGWYTQGQLADMIAVSQSTPGPIGINMATYVGFTVAGMFGSLCATLALVLPGFICVMILAQMLDKFRSSKLSERIFYGLRPASAGLITAALYALAVISLTNDKASGWAFFNWKAVILTAVLLSVTNFVKPVRNFSPIILIVVSAVVGVIFRF